MIVVMVAGAMALGLAQQTDTTFAVRAGGQLEIEAYDGAAIVRVWDRQEMRVQATHSARVRLRIRQSSSGVEIEAENRTGPATGVRIDVTVPRAYSVSIDGVNVVATVDGVQGDVDVENVQGAITIRNIVGDVTVESVSGRVLIENVRGDVSAETVEQSVLINNVRGSIDAETVDGSIVMKGIDSSAVDASTHNGIIEYDGPVRDHGRYELAAHNGQITMSIQEQANVVVTVSTHNGRIDAAFPVPVRTTRDNSFSFTLGKGSARVQIKSHNGTIRLVRPRAR